MTSRYFFAARVLLLTSLACVQGGPSVDVQGLPETALALDEDSPAPEPDPVPAPEPEPELVLAPEPEPEAVLAPEPIPERAQTPLAQEQVVQERVIERQTQDVDHLNEELAEILGELQRKKGAPASAPYVSPLEKEATSAKTP